MTLDTYEVLRKPHAACTHARVHAHSLCLCLSLYASLSASLSHAPRGGVTRQGVVLTDLESLLDCQ